MKNFYDIIPTLNGLLIVSGFVLGAYLIFAMSRPYQVGSLAGKSVSAVQPDASKLFAAAPQFSPDAFQKSRLFNSSGAKASGQQAKSFTMLGVSMGEKKLAILRDTKTNKDYYCTEGDIVADYTVKEISRDKVVLEFDGGLLEITR